MSAYDLSYLIPFSLVPVAQKPFKMRNECDIFRLQVCIEKMQDLQLALVISRLYESEFETASTYKKILRRHVLGQDKQVLSLCMSQPSQAVVFTLKNALFQLPTVVWYTAE